MNISFAPALSDRESLRDRRLTTFVPLLALRRVRACIRVGTCDCDEW